MPVMPRMDKKSKDIIFEIIQTPPNLRDLGKGKRKKKSVRGNTIGQDVVQINMKVTKSSGKPIDQLITGEKKEEGTKKEEAPK